jgi:hypothetical protein
MGIKFLILIIIYFSKKCVSKMLKNGKKARFWKIIFDFFIKN